VAHDIIDDLYGGAKHKVTGLGRKPAAAPEPLSFSIRRDEEGVIVVGVPRSPARRLAYAHGCKDLEQKAREAGGADPRSTLLSMIARGHLADTAVITDMRALVLSRRPVKEGAEAFCQGGGAESALRLRFDLDSRVPVALRMVGNQDVAHPDGPFFPHNRITAPRNEAVPLLLEGVARSSVVTWKIQVTVDLGPGIEKTFVLPEHGLPYRTSPQSGGRPVYEWRWWHHPQDLKITKRL
jgi:hypothetical protein